MTKFLLLCLALIFISCTNRVFSSNVAISTKASVPAYTDLGTVEHKDCSVRILFIGGTSDYQKIYQNILDQAKEKGGDAVVDFQIRPASHFYWLYLPFIIKECYDFIGTAVKFQGGGFDSGSSKWDKPINQTDSVKTKGVWD